MRFSELKEKYDKENGNATEVNCILPVHTTINKIETDSCIVFPDVRRGLWKKQDTISLKKNLNRLAMEQAGLRAKKTQTVGIWIIIFPSIFIWIIGFTLIARLKRTFIKPIQELNDVIFDYNNGNRMRRCPSYTISKDLQKLYDGINHILDVK